MAPHTPTTRSWLYECTVSHHRHAPKSHSFQHALFLLALDLDDEPQAGVLFPWFRMNRRGVYSYHDADHLPLRAQPNGGPPHGTAKSRLAAWLLEQGVALNPADTVRLITLPRVLGYVFNPVSFFFCYHPTGEPKCAVAEVGNTFAERKLYLIPWGSSEAGVGQVFHSRQPKEFYVSPFFDLDVEFDFRLQLPGERLEVRIDDWKDGSRVLTTALNGRRRPLTTANLIQQTLRCPWVTGKVSFLIHWHALLLWCKRVPWRAKAAEPQKQRNVLHPHKSLTSTLGTKSAKIFS